MTTKPPRNALLETLQKQTVESNKISPEIAILGQLSNNFFPSQGDLLSRDDGPILLEIESIIYGKGQENNETIENLSPVTDEESAKDESNELFFEKDLFGPTKSAPYDYLNVQLLLNDVQKYPLLTLEEEQKFCREIKRVQNCGIELLQRTTSSDYQELRNRLSRIEKNNFKTAGIFFDFINLSRRLLLINQAHREAMEVVEWINRVISSDKKYIEARNSMINSNLRMAVQIAKNLNFLELPLDERISAALMGLISAVDRFDAEQGYRFSTFAYRVIQHRIVTENLNSRLIRQPIHIRRELWALQTKISKLKNKIHSNPEHPEHEDELNALIKINSHLFLIARDITSLSEPASKFNDKSTPAKLAYLQPGRTLEDIISFAGGSDNESIIDKERFLSLILNVCQTKLSRIQDLVIRMRFGLPPFKRDYTLEEISKSTELVQLLGKTVTRERVRQIKQKALKMLKFVISNNKQLKSLVREINSIT